MTFRRKSRELALQALYYFDMDGGPPDMLLDRFRTHFSDMISEKTEPFFLFLVKGATENRDEVDRRLDMSSKNWKLSRMPAVDRNIMRLAAFELLMCPDIPPSVSINEAVEIGKKFGARESAPFINGVLDRIRKTEKVNE